MYKMKFSILVRKLIREINWLNNKKSSNFDRKIEKTKQWRNVKKYNRNINIQIFLICLLAPLVGS